MTRVLRAIAGAFSYFTILPAGAARGPAPDGFALSFLPLVGIVVGALAGATAYAVHPAGAQISYVAAFVALLVLTGAIHVDGFLDASDALFAPVGAKRRLEIMKDVRHGTFAVVAMGVLVWVWWAALQRYAPSWSFALVLAFACGLARLAMISNAWVFPYARAGETTQQFRERPSVIVAAIMAIAVAGLGFALAPAALLAIPAAIAAGLAIGWWMSTKLGGGLTGDCYGFGIVVIEALVLLTLPR